MKNAHELAESTFLEDAQCKTENATLQMQRPRSPARPPHPPFTSNLPNALARAPLATYKETPPNTSHRTIMKQKLDIPRPGAIGPDKIGVTRRTLGDRVAGEHALDAETDALDVLDGGPGGGGEEVETDYAVGVDMGVDGDGTRGVLEEEEDYFWGFYVTGKED